MLSAFIVICLLFSQACPIFAAEPQKLFELDMSEFSLSSSTCGTSSLKSSIEGSDTQAEAYTTNANYLTISRNQFRNTSGGKTTYLGKTIATAVYNWAQVGGRFSLNDVSIDNKDVSYEFWQMLPIPVIIVGEM